MPTICVDSTGKSTQNVGTCAPRADVLSQLRPGARPRHLCQHSHDVALNGPDLSFDLLEGARRLVAVEVAIEVDLVADDADAAVLRVALPGVDPGVGHVGQHLDRKSTRLNSSHV